MEHAWWDVVFEGSSIYQGKLYCGSDDGKIYEIDVKTEKLISGYQTGNGILSSAGIGYITSLRFRIIVVIGSSDGSIRCFFR